MPKVKNKHKDIILPSDVYVGKGSPFSNPYIINKFQTREISCNKYEEYWNNNKILQQETKNLKGKNLVCECTSSEKCHADFLLRKANEI